MTFFDKKQEIISVELTQYGKYLLSKGKFKPSYYDFIDDDILYDAQYGGLQENQSDISNRIRNETPSLKPQYVFSGIETKIKENIKLIRKAKNIADNDTVQQTPEKQYFSNAAIGNSDLFSQNYPSWKINFLKGKIESTKQFRTGSSANTFTPEITLQTSKFKIKTSMSDQQILLQPDEFVSKTFEDSSLIRIIGDSLVIELKEEYSPVMNSNFDVELYIQEIDSKTLEEKLIPLYFEPKNSSIVNGILIGDGTEKINLDTVTDPKSAEYFFVINADGEIADDVKQNLPEIRQDELQIVRTNNNIIKSSE